MTKVLWVADHLVTLIGLSGALVGHPGARDTRPQAVESLLPAAATVGDPVLGRSQGGGLDPAGPDSALLCRSHDPARFEDLQMLQPAGSDMASGRASSLTEAGPRLSRSTMDRRVGSARAWKTWSS
jgi:hypothetical protein